MPGETAAALTLRSTSTPTLIDDPALLDEERIADVLRRANVRHVAIGVGGGFLAVVGTAALSAALPVAGFAMIPAFVVGYGLARRHLQKQAALELGVTERCFDAIERAYWKLEQQRPVTLPRTRDDWLGRSPANAAKELKHILGSNDEE